MKAKSIEYERFKSVQEFKLSKIISAIALLTIVLSTVFTLSSCKPGHGSLYTEYKWSSQLGVNQEGFLYVEDHVLWFYDFASGQRVVLCNKPDCQHKPYSSYTNPDPECNAVLQNRDSFDGFAMHNDYVYIFCRSSINKTTLYRQKPDGDGREILTEFDWEIDPFNDIIFRDNMAYLVGVQYILDELGFGSSGNQISIVLSVDLQTGKVRELTEVKDDNQQRVEQIQVVGENLYYNYFYYDEGADFDFMAEDAYEQSLKYFNYFAYQVDISTGTEKQVLDLAEHMYGYISLDDEYIYYLSEDSLKVYSVDREDSSERVLFESKDKLYCIKLDDYLFMRQGDDISTVYCYDLLTGKTMKIYRTEKDGLPNIIYDRKWFYTYTNEDGSFSFVYMKEEDYLNGKTDYITIK